LKFKHLFETSASQEKGIFVDSYGLRLFGHSGLSGWGRLAFYLHDQWLGPL